MVKLEKKHIGKKIKRSSPPGTLEERERDRIERKIKSIQDK